MTRKYEPGPKPNSFFYREYLICKEQHFRLPDGMSDRALKKRLCLDWYIYRILAGDLYRKGARYASRSEAAEEIDDILTKQNI